jgi:hypothetical protein
MYRSGVSFTPVQPGDIEHVAANIREADRIEVYESSRREVLPALTASEKRSERTATVRWDDEPVAIFGVGRLSLTSGVGVPWMLGTDVLSRNAKHLLPYAPPMVEKMMQGHDVLRNLVHDDNKASIRWLKSMGFRMSNPVAAGWRGRNFRLFEITKEELNVRS